MDDARRLLAIFATLFRMYDELPPVPRPEQPLSWSTPADPRLPFDRPFTALQARGLGVNEKVLRRLAREGLLRRLFPGVYVDSMADDDTLMRCRALSLVVPDTAVVTDESAAWVHGVDVLARGDHVVPPPLSIDQAPGHTRVRKRGCDGGERMLEDCDVEVVHGVRVTTPLRTAHDLGRLRSRDRAFGSLDALLRTGRFMHDDLLGGVGRFKRRRGVVQLRELAPLADARAESPGESVMRLRWLDAGDLPTPRPQLTVLDRGFERYRLDLGVESLMFGAEYDGRDFHTSDDARRHDLLRRGWLRRHGWTIVVLTKEDVFGGDGQRAAARIRSALHGLGWRGSAA